MSQYFPCCGIRFFGKFKSERLVGLLPQLLSTYCRYVNVSSLFMCVHVFYVLMFCLNLCAIYIHEFYLGSFCKKYWEILSIFRVMMLLPPVYT